MKKTRKIMVITGTRAEYGILKPILNAIKKHPKIELSLLVTGMHLSHEFGYTINDIKKDGFNIDFEIDMLLCGDTKKSMAKSISIGVLGMTDAIEYAKPDIVLICGDRGEAFAATIASSFQTIPVVHLFGGDTAAGSNIDDSIRHAITKFAHIHLVATKKHRDRLIKMGEETWRVHLVGSPAVYSILQTKSTYEKDILKKYNLNLNEPILLVLQHPTSIGAKNAKDEIKETLNAIVELKHQTILIYPNADAGGRDMIKAIKEYKIYPFIKTFKSLPHEDYLTIMKNSSVMIGNSSSGIIEAPSFHIPVVNIGTRQEGREKAENVINVGYNKNEIKKAINLSLYDKNFKEKVKKCKNPYANKKTVEKVIKIISEIQIDEKLLRKKITY